MGLPDVDRIYFGDSLPYLRHRSRAVQLEICKVGEHRLLCAGRLLLIGGGTVVAVGSFLWSSADCGRRIDCSRRYNRNYLPPNTDAK